MVESINQLPPMPASLRANIIVAGFLIGTVSLAQYALWPVFGLILICLCFSLIFQNVKWAHICLFLVCGLLLGGCWVGAWRHFHQANYPFDRTVTFQGTIIQPPDTRSDHVLLTVLPKESHAAVLVRADRYPLHQYGEVVRVTGKIEHPAPFSNFNYPLYLERYGISGVMMLPKHVSKVGYSPPSRIYAALYALRNGLEARINKNLPEPESSFLAGILLGSKRAIPAGVQADLQTTGTTHIIAISGENITVLLVIILQLLPVVRPGQKLLITIIIAVFITVMTGASASVLRGAIVACLMGYVRYRSRRAWPTPLLLCGITLCLLGNPFLLAADPGFQLSFGAFAGLIYLGPFCTRLCSHLEKIPEAGRGALAETLAATLGTFPISLRVFGQLSFVGFLVNPLILWLIPPITAVSLVFIGVGGIIPLVANLCKLPLWLLLHAVLSIVGIFGNLHGGVFHTTIPWWMVGTLYAGILLISLKYRDVLAKV